MRDHIFSQIRSGQLSVRKSTLAGDTKIFVLFIYLFLLGDFCLIIYFYFYYYFLLSLSYSHFVKKIVFVLLINPLKKKRKIINQTQKIFSIFVFIFYS